MLPPLMLYCKDPVPPPAAMLTVPLLELKQLNGVGETALITGELVLATLVFIVAVQPFASVIRTV